MDLLLRVQDGEGADIVGALVRVTEIGGNAPMRYKVYGSENVMRDEEIRTDADGRVVLFVFAEIGFDVTVFDVDDKTLIYKRTYLKGDRVLSEGFDITDSSNSLESDLVKVVPSVMEIDVAEDNAEGVTFTIKAIRSDDTTGLDFNGMGSGGDGDYLANMDVDTDTGIVTVTPRPGEPGEYVGTTQFYFDSDWSRTLVTVNVLPAA